MNDLEIGRAYEVSGILYDWGGNTSSCAIIPWPLAAGFTGLNSQPPDRFAKSIDARHATTPNEKALQP